MKKGCIKVLIWITQLLPIVVIYLIFFDKNLIFKVLSVTILLVALVFSFINRKKYIKIMKKQSLDRIVSIISIEVAIFAFIETGIQIKESNKQFQVSIEKSDSIFNEQLRHSRELNDKLLNDIKRMNSSLVSELDTIQNINSTNSSIVSNQLEITKEQIKLSGISLNDYLFDTRAEVTFQEIELADVDTLSNKVYKLNIYEILYNSGRREATNVIYKQAIILPNKKIASFYINRDLDVLYPNSSKRINLYPTIVGIDKVEDFFYWRQTIYLDKKIKRQFEKNVFYHYKKSDFGELNFFEAKPLQKHELKEIINLHLRSEGLPLIKSTN